VKLSSKLSVLCGQKIKVNVFIATFKIIIRLQEMTRITVSYAIMVLLLLASCSSAKKSGDQGDSGRKYNVGFRVMTMQLTEDGIKKNLDVAVWYPTAAEPQLYCYSGPAYGHVAPGAAPLAGRGAFPMLAFSHGYGGCGLASSFFTEELAARGWIVACPDHHDSYSAVRSATGPVTDLDRKGFIEGAREIVNTTPAERDRYMYRPDELEATINGMISSRLFGGLIDTSRIAAGGHSFGGFTSMALCRTITGYHDKRIKALLLFSTGAASYLLTEDEMARVAVPSMLMMGQRERNQKRGEKTMEELEQAIFRNMPVPKYFLEIRGGTHFSFNIRTSQGFGTRLLSGNEREFDVITRYSIAFLEKYVAECGCDDSVLQSDDPMLTRYVVRQ
jgi:predicted dienelactone hydrolase